MRAVRLLVLIALICLGLLLLLPSRLAKQRPADEMEPRPPPLTEEASFSRTFGLAGASQLHIVNRFGAIEARPGGPQVEVQIRARAQGESSEAVSRLLAAVDVASQAEERLELEVAAPASGVTVDLEVRAPPQIGLVVEAQRGDVRVVEFDGPVTVRTLGGDVLVANLEGPVDIEAEFGETEVRSVCSGAAVRSGSGDVSMRDVSGPLLARTLGGDILLEAVDSDPITLNSDSGEVAVRLRRPFGGTMEARTQSGSVAIALPADSNCRVRTYTGSGEVSNTLSLQDISRSGRNISGRLGAGRGSVLVMTGSGDIELSHGG